MDEHQQVCARGTPQGLIQINQRDRDFCDVNPVGQREKSNRESTLFLHGSDLLSMKFETRENFTSPCARWLADR